jgi:acetamidase/formamidase
LASKAHRCCSGSRPGTSDEPGAEVGERKTEAQSLDGAEPTGFAETTDEAARKATRHMIEYLVAERGLARGDAYALASLAGDLKINEVVDVPHVRVNMHMPKGVFR